jgi:Ni/Co efflux regulator RcnB
VRYRNAGFNPDTVVQEAFRREIRASTSLTGQFVLSVGGPEWSKQMNRLTKAAVVAIALSTTAVPMLAEAQNRDRREYREDRRDDRRDYRDERRDDRRDWRQGDYNNRQDYRQDRRDDRRDYRDERRDDRRDYRNDRWDRNNRDWWRGRSDFRGYNGPRSGYWYAPSYGYYRVEPRYSAYRWRTGGYLPAQYRSYYVSDPYFYNLRPAPRGYRYVHAGSDIVLIAVATGLIASVLSNVY